MAQQCLEDTIDDSHQFTGSVLISGSLTVEGQTLLDSMNISEESLIVSGAMRIVDQQVGDAVRSSSIFVENLGTVGNKDLAGVIDLGRRISVILDIYKRR